MDITEFMFGSNSNVAVLQIIIIILAVLIYVLFFVFCPYCFRDLGV